jgi:CheY-like chemotaxis protein
VAISADALRLEQALSNLLQNAVKYTENGGSIDLIARREAGELVISVRDTGIGFTPELARTIFEPFVQARRTLGGLGIGLTLVRRLIELHGGSVEAHSDGPGLGSEFVIHLPIHATATETHPSTATMDEPNATGRTHRVLVVDDNLDAAHALSTLLRSSGHEVEMAHTGQGAIDLALRQRPNIVLLDIGLPDIDGYEVARRLRSEPRTSESLLVALTGYGQEDDRELAHRAGFDQHWVKPIDLTRLDLLLATLEPAKHRAAAPRD